MATQKPTFSKKSITAVRKASRRATAAPAAAEKKLPPAVVDQQKELGIPTDSMIAAGVVAMAEGGGEVVVLRAMAATPGALDHSALEGRDHAADLQRVALRNGQTPAEIVAAWYRAACGVA